MCSTIRMLGTSSLMKAHVHTFEELLVWSCIPSSTLRPIDAVLELINIFPPSITSVIELHPFSLCKRL
jgi:hypothetical protein